jgi:hypothetical protein
MATSRRYIANVLNVAVEACPTALLPASKDLVQSKLNICASPLAHNGEQTTLLSLGNMD